MSDKITIQHPLAAGAEVPADELWSFPEGLIGLEGLQRFAMLVPENGGPLELLCSIDDHRFGILLVKPTLFVPNYVLALAPEDLGPIGVKDPAVLEIRVPVVLPDENSPLTLNLKGPLILSPAERLGIQRISPDESHEVRYVPQISETDLPTCSS